MRGWQEGVEARRRKWWWTVLPFACVRGSLPPGARPDVEASGERAEWASFPFSFHRFGPFASLVGRTV
jgi:hypothetical protein